MNKVTYLAGNYTRSISDKTTMNKEIKDLEHKKENLEHKKEYFFIKKDEKKLKEMLLIFNKSDYVTNHNINKEDIEDINENIEDINKQIEKLTKKIEMIRHNGSNEINLN